jgi:hypothetical protein
LGHPTDFTANYVTLSTAGTETYVHFRIVPKAGGSIILGDGTTGDIYTNGDLYVNEQNTYFGGNAYNPILQAKGAGSGHPAGWHVTLRGGAAYLTGDNDGGDLYLYGGAPNGTGTRGQIYFGDGSSIATLQNDETESNAVGYDTTTGLLSYMKPQLIKKAEILYSNVAQTTIITLPTDAVIWDIQVEVVTAFTGTGTDLLDIGTSGTGNRYEDDLDISSTGWKTLTLSNVPDRMTGSTAITFQYFDQNSDAGAGQAFVYILYSIH